MTHRQGYDIHTSEIYSLLDPQHPDTPAGQTVKTAQLNRDITMGSPRSHRRAPNHAFATPSTLNTVDVQELVLTWSMQAFTQAIQMPDGDMQEPQAPR